MAAAFLPLCDQAELEQELAAVDDDIVTALDARVINADAAVRREERVATLLRWRAGIRAQLAGMGVTV